MGRGRRNKRLPDREAIRLFAEYHIVAVRRSKSGEITEVKHSTYGWLKADEYYMLQKMHDALPAIEKVIEGGYRMKAALYNSYLEVEVLNTGVKLPLGVVLVIGALLLYEQDPEPYKTLDLLALALPFGEIYLISRGIVGLASYTKEMETNLQALWADTTGRGFPYKNDKGETVYWKPVGYNANIGKGLQAIHRI